MFPASHLRYGSGTRHVRCDVCLRTYLPQHINRRGPVGRWWWVCGNCSHDAPRAFGDRLRGIQLRPDPYRRHADRWAALYEIDAPLREREAAVIAAAGL